MNFDVPDFSQYEGKTAAELTQMKYDKLLDGFLRTIDDYAVVSMAVKDGKVTADEAIEMLDDRLRPIAIMLMLLDNLRGENSLQAREQREKDLSDEELVAKFREQLGDL